MLPTEDIGLFDNYKLCPLCGKRLPHSYKEEYCPLCIDANLLNQVKDFIRENDVNEYQVADHFDIPVRHVKEWIREGRIEYRQTAQETINKIYCHICGAAVTFGTVCAKCLKQQNKEAMRGFVANGPSNKSDRMHFLDN